MDAAEVIRRITQSLEQDTRVRALFLSGSHGNGLADTHSDIDFILITDDGPTDEIAALWKEAVARTGEIVLCWDRSTVPVLINMITADWTRTDALLLKPTQIKPYARDSLRPLIDHDRIYDTLAAKTPVRRPDAKAFLRQVQDFIRILGLLPLAIGRKEYLNGVLGLFHLRNHLVELMISETQAPHRGGILHLNRLITDEQKAVLTALPSPVPDRDALIAAHMAYAGAYLPRARRMAAQLGVDWPERFEEIMRARLSATLDVSPSAG